MAINSDLITIEDACPIEISKIIIETSSFDNKIKIEKDISRTLIKLQECLLHFRKAKNMIRSFFKPEINKYIEVDTLNILDENLGRVDQNLEQAQKQSMEKYNSELLWPGHEKENIKMNPFKNLLIEAMESIVINPIISSTKKYIFSDEETLTNGQQIEKDEYLYVYYLFQEVYPASQSVGALTRQEFKTFPKNFTIANNNPIGNLPIKSREGLEEQEDFISEIPKDLADYDSEEEIQ